MSLTNIITNTAFLTYSYSPAPERPPITIQIQDSAQNIVLSRQLDYQRPQQCVCQPIECERYPVEYEKQPVEGKKHLEEEKKDHGKEEKPKSTIIDIHEMIILPVPCRCRCIVEAVDLIDPQVEATIGESIVDGVSVPAIYINGSYIIRIRCLSRRGRRRQFYHRQFSERIIPVTGEVTSVEITEIQIETVRIEDGLIYIEVVLQVKRNE